MIIDGISPPLDIRIHNNDINTLERAVKERVFFVQKNGKFVTPPRPASDNVFSESLAHFRVLLGKFLPKTAPISRIEFAGSYRGRKAIEYALAVESLCGQEFQDKDADVDTFLKVEKTNFTAKPDAVARVISPRKKRYNVELGRYLKPNEEKVYKAIQGVYGDQTVMKGLNSAQSGRLMTEKWSSFNNPCAIGLDASRFDQHVSVSALKWEHAVYKDCFYSKKHRNRVEKLCSYQLRNHCVGYAPDGKVDYTTTGTRMSGDVNTGLGNCLLMCAMVWSYADSIKVKIKLANNGDDCVVFMERDDIGKFQEGLDGYFLKLGFSMVAEEPVFELENVQFCQTNPVYCGEIDAYIMVRDPRIAVAKDCSSTTWYTTDKLRKGWLHAVGTGGLALAGQMPIWQDFYQLFQVAGKFYKKVDSGQSWGVRSLTKNMTRHYGEISPRTRASFYLAFGITPEEQLVSEAMLQRSAIGAVGDRDVCPRPYPFFPLK